MKPTVVIGSQWGDEGKGKLVDALSSRYDIVGRFNGGNNAGHTVIYRGQQVKLHVLPSGVFNRKHLVIAQGAVFDPEVLYQELKFCQKNKVKVDLLIDYRTNLVMPYHKLMDAASEAWKGKKATGSVKVGIGFCYEDRNNRSGIRCEDLLYPNLLKAKIRAIFPLKKAILEKVYGMSVKTSPDVIYRRLMDLSKVLLPFMGDVSSFILRNLNRKTMLFEGAMATMLDASFGTYPYTVANHTLASAIFTSLGIPETPLRVIGVVKAYTTRVGSGPFPTEQTTDIGKTLQTVGKEIAATSGRIRRCGWLDLNLVRFAHRLNRFSCLAVTKLDVLGSLTKISVATGYKLNRKSINQFPAISHDFYRCQPVYKSFSGWNKPLEQVKSYSDLPKTAKNYLEFIEREINVPIRYISVGADREALIQK